LRIPSAGRGRRRRELAETGRRRRGRGVRTRGSFARAFGPPILATTPPGGFARCSSSFHRTRLGTAGGDEASRRHVRRTARFEREADRRRARRGRSSRTGLPFPTVRSRPSTRASSGRRSLVVEEPPLAQRHARERPERRRAHVPLARDKDRSRQRLLWSSPERGPSPVDDASFYRSAEEILSGVLDTARPSDRHSGRPAAIERPSPPERRPPGAGPVDLARRAARPDPRPDLQELAPQRPRILTCETPRGGTSAPPALLGDAGPARPSLPPAFHE